MKTIGSQLATLLAGETLQSLAGQQLPDGVKMEIVVVNNDPQTDLKERVWEFADDHELVIKYDIEPEQNISLARNRSIELASGNWIAFIDDDEMADPGLKLELAGSRTGPS